jgi:hypothetical protein
MPIMLFIFNTYRLRVSHDLARPSAELEKQKHKLKRLVQSPNSFFMDVKCSGCYQVKLAIEHKTFQNFGNYLHSFVFYHRLPPSSLMPKVLLYAKDALLICATPLVERPI